MMKQLVIAAGLMALSGCVTPTPPSGAVPFSQVLAENAGKPFECTNYDAATDSCEGVATYRDLGNGQFAFTGDFLVTADLPAVRLTGTAVQRDGLICTDLSNASVSSASGAQDLNAELMFAEMESLLKSIGETCGAYVPAGGGYMVRAVTGPSFVTSQPDQAARFFNDRKGLRVPSL